MTQYSIADLTRTVRVQIKPCEDEGCECWIWHGALDSSGYASFKLKGKVVLPRGVKGEFVGNGRQQPLRGGANRVR